MLYSTPDLDRADRTVLDEIEQFRQRLRYQLAEPRGWHGQLRRTLAARAIQGSNSIEGYQVSLDDAEDVVEYESPLEGADSVPPEIVGYQRDADLSDNQAIRDLRLLAGTGLLRLLGETRGRSYTAGESLVELGRQVGGGLAPIRDPYA